MEKVKNDGRGLIDIINTTKPIYTKGLTVDDLNKVITEIFNDRKPRFYIGTLDSNGNLIAIV